MLSERVPAHGMQLVAGVDRYAPGGVDDPDLAHRRELVGLQQRRQRVGRCQPVGRSRSSPCGPCAISTTDCVATAPTPGRAQMHSAADGEPVRVHGRAVLAGVGIEGDKRVRHERATIPG